MKKNSFNLPFKSNFFKEQDPFHLVVVFFIIFFGTAIFFSIPTFYDYKKYNQEIEKTINNEFKINIHNLYNISYRFIPSPHLLIKKADLKLKKNESNLISELNDIKVFISITDLYKKKKFKINKIEVNKANFYLNFLSLNNFINNLKNNIINHFNIKKSKIFFKNKKDEVILISTINNFDYYIDLSKGKKNLKMDGNIFDTNYEFKYIKDYQNPNIQNIVLKLKDPNLNIKNYLKDRLASSYLDQKGEMDIQFLNTRNSISYSILENYIELKNIKTKNDNFDLNGTINFNPFYFDLSIDLKKIDFIQLEKLFYLIYKNKNLRHENLSGKLTINLNNIEHKILNMGLLSLIFENEKINFNKKVFNLKEFANLEISDYEYLDNIDQILQMKIKINIINNEKFNRFLFNYNKDKIKNKNLYFIYQFNSSSKTNFISKISKDGFSNNTDFYKFNNLQQLKILLMDEKLFIED